VSTVPEPERVAAVSAGREHDAPFTAARVLTLGYFTNQYPAVSHTFIRREIRELECRGHAVHRFAIRPGDDALVDPQDIEEQGRTHYILGHGALRLAGSALRAFARRPARALGALRRAISLASGSEAGLLKHLAYWAEALVLATELERRGVEHVHVHHGTNPATVMMLVKMMGGPSFSVTMHGPPEFDAPRALRLKDKVAAARFIVVVSDFGRAQLQRWASPEDWKKIHVVRCSIGPAFVDRAEPRISTSDVPMFVSVGRLCAQKAQHTLVEAMALLRERGTKANLVIVGDGPLRPMIEGLVRDRNLGDRVEMAGALSEAQVRERMCLATALVMSSSAEGLPLVLVESLAMGVPVIATRIAGIPELVDESCGRLVPPARPDLLAEAMVELAVMEEGKRRSLGDEGRRRVRERHWTATEVARLEALFLGCLGTSSPSSRVLKAAHPDPCTR